MPRPTRSAPKAPPPPKRSSPILPIGVTLLALGGLVFWLSRPNDTPSPAPPMSSQTSAPVAAASADFPLASAVPDAPSPIDPHDPLGAYVGQKRCQECHADQHARWTKDWHARALNPATQDYVVGDYNHTHFKGSSSEASMNRDKGKYTMRTVGKDGQPATFAANWVVGGKRMQDTLTEFPDGRWQILPVYYHVTGKGEWVDYTESKQGALTPNHPFFWANFRRTANHECLDCHTTGLKVTYDRTTHHWDTRMMDAGVACESCHGPGARHSETQDPADILHPGKASAEVGLALCGQCHGPRQPLFPMLDAAHHFVPGQRYDAHFLPHGLISGRTRSGDFFADGRPKSSSFEYQALIQSRCHLEGKATCLTCHTPPHAKEHDDDELKVPKDPLLKRAERADSSACQGCHARLFVNANDHTHHTSTAAQSCLGCHLPKVVTGVLDTFADHAIDVPAPENTERHGIPNACNECHKDKTPADMVRAMDGWWPKSAERRARRVRLADAFDEKTAPQSEQALRAVIADRREAAFLRANAAQFLADRFPKAATEAILPLFAESDALLRTRACEAVALTRAKGAADSLARLGQDPSIFVREAAAVALFEIGDARAEAAARALTSARETEGLPRPHLLVAILSIRRNDMDAALKEAERAIELQPYFIDALVVAADLYALRDQPDRTEALLHEALSFDPQHPGANERLRVLMTGRP